MVTVVNYRKRKSEDGRNFYALIVEGEVEILKSEKSGEYYASTMQASIQSTLNKESCEGLIGQKISGRIIKEETEPFDYELPSTGETIELSHTYKFIPDLKEAEKSQTG